MACLFDSLPWEILHMIFDFLKTIDLLCAFVQINPNLDAILRSYSRIQLNFKSIKKSSFEFICEYIHPEQVQSLVLSDDEHTPGQIDLFMSRIRLDQMINLQSMTIFQVHDINLLCKVLSRLENHVRIQSLSVDSGPISISMNKKTRRSIAESMVTLPSLKYLTFMNSLPFSTIRQPLSELSHLAIRSCTYSDLKMLLHWLPNLLNLQIWVPYNEQHMPTFDYVPPHLRSLAIESKSWMLFNELEALLSLTPLLERLMLEIMGEQELLNGRRWQLLIETKLPLLKKFDLSVSPEQNTMSGDDVLTPFQSPFWLIEKRWYMACTISTSTDTCARLFSVPHFAPHEAWYPSYGFLNYSIVPYPIDDSCIELKISHLTSLVPIQSPYRHVQTLELQSTIDDIEQVKEIVNLSSVNHLKLADSIQCRLFADLLRAAPRIEQLTTSRKILRQIIDSFSNDGNGYEQIKKFNLNDDSPSIDIDRFCRVFPRLERISLFVKESDDIRRILNGLEHLISAIFRWSYQYHIPPLVSDEWLQQNNLCIDGTYRLSSISLYLWID